jgi:hypothetical protein
MACIGCENPVEETIDTKCPVAKEGGGFYSRLYYTLAQWLLFSFCHNVASFGIIKCIRSRFERVSVSKG